MVSIAKLTGAPVHEGDTETAFDRVVTAIDAAIQRNPASWNLWFKTDVMARLGLVRGTCHDGH